MSPATYLLDVNVLVALIDPNHVHHDAAHAWFERTGCVSFATCPLTENGVLRVLGHAHYPNGLGSPAALVPAVLAVRGLAGHVFWPDTVSLADPHVVDGARLLGSEQLSDVYLLALAVAHGGRLATFDRRISAAAVRAGAEALHLIPA